MRTGATFDYVVIGGGSSGCALASRLSDDPTCRVLLLEAGSRDWSPYIHLPVCYYKTTKGPYTWGFHLASQAHQDGIAPVFTQARVLGGGSSINAQVYIRGTAADYDGWAGMGCPGWSYREVLPYFKRSEANERLAGEFHGIEGPLGVSDQRHTHPLSKAFVQACQDYGMPHNADFNGREQAGAGLYQVTNRNGRRCSAAVAYLGRARGRPNLSVRTGCLARRIVVENGRAAGVEYQAGKSCFTVRAQREVVLAAGAINSPKLLMLSGIGPARHLESHGIKPVADLPGVGRNLHDHLDIFMMYNVKTVESYDAYKRIHRQIWAGLQYALFRSGPVSATVVEGGAFWTTAGRSASPDLQFHFLAGTGIEAVTGDMSTGNGCTLNAYVLDPSSRGAVTLTSADPRAAPNIDPNFLAERDDLDRTVEAVRIGQEIMAQPSIARYIRDEFMPGRAVRTRADYEAYVRRESRSGYHPVGTCRMGQDDMAVVDPQLRVRGVEGLRVADASIMPRLVSGNTNAPSIMIGERAADFLRGNRSAVATAAACAR
ncbi:GMC family oxidoreductase [Labrys wisconsinensis]|uniref:Choline dehydrogenase-like flavoprotein n=1 Tax=Labrys wisconsinensis TaxID=425677 RepID=A0ABU0J2Z4_9HYPH|nr:GMC family oxidoreductase N-terminal domain-containing protein [Labrys wisconsinensis]MDQ0468635.1 choline dehydrogenase-like flavoprotein [Labrys wisconsinensis]